MERRILRILVPSRSIDQSKHKSEYMYVYENDKRSTPITDAHVLDRIRALHVPPAYTNVVIYPREEDKIQAFGYDAKGRKQTTYAKWFVEQQSAIKFDRVLRLKRIIPKIQADVNRTLKGAVDALPKLPVITNHVQVCIVVKLMMLCNFRIGNSVNATKYKSYGLTTIQWRHIAFDDDDDENAKVTFSFVGKKGVLNEAGCTDKRIVKLLQHMYMHMQHNNSEVTENQSVFTISASHVNEYLKSFSQSDREDISSKDLRTWQANALFMKYFNKNKKDATMSLKKRQTYAVERVAEALHNTPAVCRRSYIYPEFLMSTP